MLFFKIIYLFINNIMAESPKLILHFDINLTLIAEDPIKKHSLKNVLNSLLAENYYDKWNKDLKESISYADYIKNYIFPGNKSDKDLKEKRYLKILDFMNFLKLTNHKDYEELNKKFNFLEDKIKNSRSIVFESFFNLINFLDYNKVDYSIVLRTFGSDYDRVMKEIINFTNPNFFKFKGNFNKDTLTIESILSKDKIILTDIKDIYDFFINNGNMVIRDDWQNWNNNGEKLAFGKKFPINFKDHKNLAFFFDDHAEENYGIINPIDISFNKIINFKELIDSKNIFKVDTLQAIQDSEYFIDLIKQANLKFNFLK